VYDATFANNSFDFDIRLKLKPEDFGKAQKVFDEYYQTALSTIDKDYYLFGFTDQELLDIICKSDEWGEFDYQLAQKILADRGKEIKPEIVELLTAQRTKDLAKPAKVSNYLIYKSYFSAIAGGLPAIAFGYSLIYSKKTIRNGEQVYTYSEAERKHGERIIWVGAVSLLLWLTALLYFKGIF
jgi:hypothetical protein